MTRRPDPAIRAALTEKAVAYVLSHGIADLSLRPLAKALGTSARMLVYHFGSREGLMREILEGVRQYGDEKIMAWMNAGARSMPEFLEWYWTEISRLDARPLGLLIFELYALALRHPESYPGVLTAPLAYWRKLARTTGIPAEEREAVATLLMAAGRGLHLDLCATGDRKRIDAAVTMLAVLIERSALAPSKDSPRSRRSIAKTRKRGVG